MPLAWGLRIPRQHYDAFAYVLALPADRFQTFLAALMAARPTLSVTEYTSHVAKQVDENVDRVNEVVDMLASLYSIRADMNLSPGKFIDRLVDALEHTASDALKPADGNWQPTRERLTALLGVGGSLAILAKATSLTSHQEHTFFDAQIVTDVRPIFSDSPSDHPAAVLIVHSLRISYFQGTDREEFFVALDSVDLRRMQDVLARADLKTKSLESFLEPTSVPVLKEEAE